MQQQILKKTQEKMQELYQGSHFLGASQLLFRTTHPC